MEQLTKMLKIFLLILLFISVCYSVNTRSQTRRLNLAFQNETATTPSSKIIGNRNKPSTSGVRQTSDSIPTKTYITKVDKNGKKTYLCTNCTFETSSQSTASHHWYTLHGGRVFVCGQCVFSTCVKRYFEYHQLAVHGDKKNKPYKCDHCEYAAAIPGYLSRHINNVHRTDSKKYRCAHCTFESKYRWNFRQHLERKHPDIYSDC